MRKLTIVWMMIGVASLGATPAVADPPCFAGLGDLPGGNASSWAWDVSADGNIVVGGSSTANDTEAFRWECGVMEGLGTETTEAYGVSADGTVVVGLGFRWRDGVVTSVNGSLRKVSDNGDIIVGHYQQEGVVWWNLFPFQLIDPGSGDIGYPRDISADGLVVVGSISNCPGAAAYWHDGEMFCIGDLPGGNHSATPYAVTPDGSVIVGRGFSDNGLEAFRWEAGEMIALGDLPGGEFQSFAFDVSADGSVVVGYSVTGQGEEAFIWDADNGMRRLLDVLGDLNLASGWALHQAEGISHDGRTIVGNGGSPAGHGEGWIARLWEHDSWCPGDLDGDNDVDLADLSILLANYGDSKVGDFDCDCDTDLTDLGFLLEHYGTTCN